MGHARAVRSVAAAAVRAGVVGAWALLAFLAYAALWSPGARPSLAERGIADFLAFVLAGFLLGLAWRRRPLLFLALGLVAAAVLLEAGEVLGRGRSGWGIELLMKLLGGGMGFSVAAAVEALLRRLRAPRLPGALMRLGCAGLLCAGLGLLVAPLGLGAGAAPPAAAEPVPAAEAQAQAQAQAPAGPATPGSAPAEASPPAGAARSAPVDTIDRLVILDPPGGAPTLPDPAPEAICASIRLDEAAGKWETNPFGSGDWECLSSRSTPARAETETSGDGVLTPASGPSPMAGMKFFAMARGADEGAVRFVRLKFTAASDASTRWGLIWMGQRATALFAAMGWRLPEGPRAAFGAGMGSGEPFTIDEPGVRIALLREKLSTRSYNLVIELKPQP